MSESSGAQLHKMCPACVVDSPGWMMEHEWQFSVKWPLEHEHQHMSSETHVIHH